MEVLIFLLLAFGVVPVACLRRAGKPKGLGRGRLWMRRGRKSSLGVDCSG